MVRTMESFRLIRGTRGPDSIDGGEGSQLIVGGDGDDDLDGGPGHDILYGDYGNDTLFGGNDADPDTLIGGYSDDTHLVLGPEDVVVEEPGQGIDTIVSLRSRFLGDHEENLVLQEAGAGDDGYAIGNPLDNRLTGNSGDNTFDGRAGDDLISAGAGRDVVWAGDGNDTAHGGPGNDRMDGGAGSDLLYGDAGNDTLFAGDDTDRDTLAGGAGNDTYWVNGTTDIDAPQDIVLEEPGAGIDTLLVKGSWRMGDGVENLVVQERPWPRITMSVGNGLDNRMLGNSGDNSMYGLGGDDWIDGRGGSDNLWGSGGDDLLLGREGDDVIIGGGGDDLIIGGDGNDALGTNDLYQYTGSGRDTLVGGRGDDDLSGGGEPGRFGWVDFADAPDRFLFAEEHGGFGHDTIRGFNDENDRILFPGYGRDDLARPVTVTTGGPYSLYPGAMSWTANFAFDDGSTLHVTGVSRGTPSFTEGSDFAFRDGPLHWGLLAGSAGAGG